MSDSLEKVIEKSVNEHFNGLVAIDEFARTRPFLQLDCLIDDIAHAIRQYLAEVLPKEKDSSIEDWHDGYTQALDDVKKALGLEEEK